MGGPAATVGASPGEGVELRLRYAPAAVRPGRAAPAPPAAPSVSDGPTSPRATSHEPRAYEPRATSPPSRAASPGAAAPARSLGRVEPIYPAACVRHGHEGVCRLEVRVGADGRALGVRVMGSAGCEGLDRSALEAARSARYQSASRDGRAVESTLVLAVRFVLR
ncbi:MAG: energy transducer TonB [Planctomycetes bacterium]|nr:energy transducer TonB [Planctomycetota bacterium]